MKTNNIEHDQQLAELLKDSFAERAPHEADRLTQRVMRRLPQRRRKSLLTMLLAYIQSPFWLVTAIIAGLCIVCLRTDYLQDCMTDTQKLVMLVAAVTLGVTITTHDMLRDT